MLLLDTSRPRVEAAIAVGDIDTAQNVAVFTPGFTSTVDGSMAAATSGHTEYLDQTSTSLYNMAAIVTGNNGLAVPQGRR